MEDISSTDIRQYLKDNKDISKYVPIQVARYIKKKNLYND